MRDLLKKAHRLRRVPAKAARDAFTDFSFVSRYFAMGATSTVINFGTFWILYDFFGLWYLISAALSFLIRLFFKFHSMRTWLFGMRVLGINRRHLFIFSMLEVGYLSGNLILLAIFVELAGLKPFVALVISAAITSAIALVLTRLIFKPE